MRNRIRKTIAGLIVVAAISGTSIGFAPSPASAHGGWCFDWWLRTCHVHEGGTYRVGAAGQWPGGVL